MWTCRKCGSQWTNGKLRCTCGRKAPKRKPSHKQVLKDLPYEWWVERYGERCGLCGKPPKPGRRLNRDHDHNTGEPRGLLCPIPCNKFLHRWMTPERLRNMADYLERACANGEDGLALGKYPMKEQS